MFSALERKKRKQNKNEKKLIVIVRHSFYGIKVRSAFFGTQRRGFGVELGKKRHRTRACDFLEPRASGICFLSGGVCVFPGGGGRAV